jgi:putative transcriptional regulator
MIASRVLPLLLLVAGSALSQEIRYIDLTAIKQRAELRYPPAPPVECEKGTVRSSGGYGGVSVGDGAPDWRDPHALEVELLRVSPADVDPAEPFEAEFRVLNTGRAPIDIPVSPHLSDLQPSDASLDFTYFSLALVAEVAAEPEGPAVSSLGFVELYGSPDQDGTMVVLKPGEWIRVTANIKLQPRSWPMEQGSARFRGEFWLRKNTFHPHPGGKFIEIHNLYPNRAPTKWLPAQLTFHPKSEMPSAVFLPVQSNDAKDLGPGKLLVASRGLADPNFAKTVILLVHFDDHGVVGLILNRRTEIPLSRVLEEFEGAKDRSDPAYLGGPVEIPSAFALFRSPAKIEGAERVFSRVYLISTKALFEQTLAARPDPEVFHVYLGYAGWTNDQLRREVELGGWFIFPADTAAVFNSDPGSLWPEMIRKTELKFAGSQPANFGTW